MKLVIDIPKEQYTTLNAKTQDDIVDVIDHGVLIKAIKNGTPLPKGHEYIDRNNAITSVCQWFTTAERNRLFSFTTNIVKQIVTDILCDEPTIIEADKGEQERKQYLNRIVKYNLSLRYWGRKLHITSFARL